MNERLHLLWHRFAERIDALSTRERGLVFVAVMVLLLFAANTLLFTPLRTQQKRLEQDLKDRQTQSQALEKQMQLLLESSTRDPDAENRARLEALRTRIKQMDEELGRLVAGFVSPRDMAKLVEQALKESRGLEFVKVENIPPRSLADEKSAPEAESAKAAPAPEVAVYKHGLRIEMKGGYREIVTYLRALEALPWKVFWGEVSLETEKYPVSRVTVVIYTLSRHRGWIGT
jgi:MSHA biogenesis protein MshJ